jgi:hypothetical protein
VGEMNKLIEKWKPVLEITDIDQEYWYEISKYFERYHDAKHEPPFNNIGFSVRILSKLPLSKVMFTDNRDICKPYKCSTSVTREQIYDIQAQTGIDVIVMVESAMINEMSLSLVKEIEKEGGIVISGLFDVSLSKMDFNKTLEVTGYILPFDVYRYYKLKRIESIINERKS